MKMGAMGGLMFGGLVSCALFGFLPGAILILLGAAIGCHQLVKEKQAEAKAESWRAEYPSYKY